MKTVFASKFLSYSLLSFLVMINTCFYYGVFGERSYRLNLQKLEVETDEHFVNFTNLRVYKYNRSVSALNGSFDILRDIPETVVVELLGYEKIGNEYILSGIQFREDLLCSQMVKYKEVLSFPGYEDITNFIMQCPVTKGSYHIINYRPEHHALPDNVPGHYWRFDVKAYDPAALTKNMISLKIYLEIERLASDWNPMNG